MNYLRELAGQVLSSLLRDKLRTFLTMAGIAWGIASMVIVVAMCDGFKEGQRNNMRGLGENIVILFAGRTEMQAGGERAGRRIRLSYSDVENIRRDCWLVKKTAAELESEVRATSPYNSGTFEVSGVESFFPDLRTIPVAQGRFFTEREEGARERVCVIGMEVKKQLFGQRADIVGREIAINSLPYRIIGVMADKEQNSSYSGLDEKKIWIPYATMARDVPPKNYYVPGFLSEIIYQPRSLREYEAAQRQVRAVVGRAHGFAAADKSALSLFDTVESQQLAEDVLNSMATFLGLIALVTLSLGGIGVMNIMLVTVSERTREIGLRKALGATRRRIMIDFLAEGCVLAFVSGSIGWSIAFGLSSLLKLVKMPDMFPGLPVSGSTTAVAFGALAVIAILSALFPAWRAASLTPVEALRYER